MNLWDVVVDLEGIFPKGRPGQATTLPPYDPNFSYFIFVREPFDNKITLLQPTGHSWEVTIEQIERYLALYKLNEAFITRLTNYIWGFYSVILDLEYNRFEQIPMEEIFDELTGKLRLPDVVRPQGVQH